MGRLVFFMKSFIKKLGKDASSCLKGFSRNLTDSPTGTLKTLFSPSLVGVAIMATDGAISCGKNVVERRKIEKKACTYLRQNDINRLNRIYQEYKFKGHGSFNRMTNTCGKIIFS